MDERFLAVGEAATRVGRDPQTIRRWAANGQVRRRTRGRIVEYCESDLLAVAGLGELDARDREIAQLRADLSQTRQERDVAIERARERQAKIDSFQRRAAARYHDYEAAIASLRAEQSGSAGQQAVIIQQQAGQLRQIQREQTEMRQAARARQQQIEQLVALIDRYAALVGRLVGRFTGREDREEAERLLTEAQRLRGG